MDIFQYTEEQTKQKHFLTYKLARLFGNKDIITYFFLFYIYLRILDDKIDDELNSRELKLKYLGLHKNALETKDISQLDGKEREILNELFKFDKDWDYFLTGKILKMISIFEFDIERINQYVEIDTLFKYFYRESDVSLATILFFIIPNSRIDIGNTIKIGFVAKLIHTIRDLDEDIREGIYNTPIEFKDQTRMDWLNFAKEKIREEIRTGYKGLPEIGNFKYALVCIVNSNRYKWEFYSTLHPAFGWFYRIFYFKKIFLDIFIMLIRFLFMKRRNK